MSISEKKTETKTPRSLMATLAIAFLSLSVVVLLIASSIQVYLYFQAQQETISNRQQLIAEKAGNTVASFIQEKFSVLEAAVKLGSPTASSPEEQQRVVDNLLGLQPSFRHLLLLNAQEQELVRASRLSQAVWENFTNRIESDVFEQIRQGQRYISPVQVDEVTSEPLVIMAVPATDIFGDFQGTLIAEVNLKFMWDLVEQLEVGESGYAYVVNRQGDLIAYGDVARVLRGENVSHVNEVAEFTDGTTSADETVANVFEGIEETTVVGTYVPLGTPDWAVVTELPVREAYQPIIRGVALSLAAILAMATLAGVMGVVVARRLSVPLLDLTETATRIAEGELGLEATAKGPRETIRLADAFNSMTTQLQELIDTLEQRVADRTRALETSREVSRSLSTILETKQLVTEVVEQVRAAFNYYHAHIYLFGEENQALLMVGGTGEAGQQMLAAGHRIKKGQGLVGRAAETNEAVLVPDVSRESGWLPNPRLPDTRAEIAVPIALGDEVLGVLDVQHHVTGGLTQQDVELLQSIANQVAIALRNARVYEQAQQQAEREALINMISQKIQQATSIENVLQITARELGQALRVQQTKVQLGSKAQPRNGHE